MTVRWLRRERAAAAAIGEESFGAALRSVASRWKAGPHLARVLQVAFGIGVTIAAIILPIRASGAFGFSVVVGLATGVLLLAVAAASVARSLSQSGRVGFGLIGGSSGRPFHNRGILDILAGAPQPTVPDAVVPWLNTTLSALAGLPADEVLRFGTVLGRSKL